MSSKEVILEKPFSQASENNKAAIAEGLDPYLRGVSEVLEIGSGTGQHAVYFAQRFPELTWQPSDVATNHAGIKSWLHDAGLPNIRAPIELDINSPSWGNVTHQAIYLSNVVHIIEPGMVELLFQHLKSALGPEGLLFMYGPYNYGGRFTSDGNKRLDDWLKSLHPEYGIREFVHIDKLARSAGLMLLDDCTMPANNRLLIWRRINETK